MPEPFDIENAVTDEKQDSAPTAIDLLVHNTLEKANANNPEYKKNTELIARQRAVLTALPDNFIEELTAHLQASYIEQSKYPNFSPDQRYDRNVLKGEIFERLVELEDSIYHFDPNWESHPQTDEQKKIAELLLELMATPERFNLERHSTRNPDMVKFIFDKDEEGKDVFYIGAAIEAKTHLDDRSLVQLKSFMQSFASTIKMINDLEDAKSHGLSALGKGGNQIRISQNYYQILAVPRNASLTDYGQNSNFIDFNMQPEKRRELISLLKNSSKTKIARTSFSTAEIAALSQVFEKEVYARLENQAEQLSN